MTVEEYGFKLYQCVSIFVREVKVLFLSFLMSFGKFCSFML
jgi:hypothetical protein